MVKGLYSGHVDFAAKKIENQWEIYQFSLRNYGWIIILDENGNWHQHKQKKTIGIKDSIILDADYNVIENATSGAANNSKSPTIFKKVRLDEKNRDNKLRYAQL